MSAPSGVNAFLDLACLTYDGNDSPLRRRKALELLEANRDIAHANVYAAAATGNVDALERFLTLQEETANAPGGPRGWPPLLYLCYSRVPEHALPGEFLAAAKTLLHHGADPNGHFMWGGTYRFTALTGAIGEGEQGIKNQPPHEHAMELAVKLLDAGADPNDGQGLYDSMFREDNRWLELLLNRGLEPSHEINWKTTHRTKTMDFILGHAVTKGFTARVRLLLAHGADAGSVDHYNKRSHLTNAVLNGFTDIADLLRQHGARTEPLSPEEEFRSACMRGDAVTARALLQKDPQLIRDASLVQRAAANGLQRAVELLIDLGADINAFTADGTTALHQVAWHGRRDIAEVLLSRGAKMLRDKTHRSTPVGWAAYSGQRETLIFLLERTEDIFDLVAHASPDALRRALRTKPDLVHARDPDGNSPAHHVTEARDDAETVLQILVECGADLEATNNEGLTALDAARSRGADNVVDMLERLRTISDRFRDTESSP